MVELGRVGFGYRGRPVFEAVSLVLAPGRTYGLLGLNGAGKSTLLKLLSGPVFPDSGRVRPPVLGGLANVYEHVSPRRLWYPVREDFVRDFRRWALIGATAAGMVPLASLMDGSSSFPDSAFHRRWFVFLLFVIGIPATFQALRPFHDRALKEPYFLVPASTPEKAFARLLTTTAVLAALLLAFSVLASLVIESLDPLVFFGYRRLFFDPNAGALWTVLVLTPLVLWFLAWLRPRKIQADDAI